MIKNTSAIINKKTICALIVFLYSLFTNMIVASQTEQTIQLLHNKINKDLLSIKKEYPKTQPVIYSLLDQVCKLYQISKSAIAGKKKLKTSIQSQELENRLIKGENSNLKNELAELKKDLLSTQQNISSIAKKLEQKNLLLSIKTKEQQKLVIEKERLETEKKVYIKKNNKVNLANNTLSNTIPQKTNQSLSLTSTSAPNSPL
ncbi:hypothetical protein ACFLYH_01550 [Candidatus Dependentiae bacterium]